MKRIKSLILAFIAIFTLAILSIGANAEDTLKCDVLFGASYNSKKIGSYSDDWYVTASDGSRFDIHNANNNNNSWDHIRIGSSKAVSVAYVANHDAIEEKVSVIEINFLSITAAKVNSANLYVSSTSDFATKNTYAITKSSGLQTVSIPASEQIANGFYKIEFDCAKGKNNGFVQISEIKVYVAGSASSLTALADPEPVLVNDTVMFEPVANATSYKVGIFSAADAITPIKEYDVAQSSSDIEFDLDFKPQGSWHIKVKAIGDGETYSNSNYAYVGEDWCNYYYDEINLSQLMEKDTEPEGTTLHTYYEITAKVGEIKNTSYANFDLVDDSSNSIYVYGLKANAVATEETTCAALGIRTNDVITIRAYKIDYKGSPELIGYYVNTVSRYSAITKYEPSTSLRLTYEKVDDQFVYDDISLRFSTTLRIEDYEEIMTSGTDVEFGMVCTYADLIDTNAIIDLNTAEAIVSYVVCTPVRVDDDGNEDAEGEFYQFALVITNIDFSDIDESLACAVYAKVDGIYYNTKFEAQSVTRLASIYCDMTSNPAIMEHIEVLSDLASYVTME